MMMRMLRQSGQGGRDYQFFLWPPALEFDRRFPTEEACRDFLFQARWPNGFACRRCGPAPCRWADNRRILCLRCHKLTALTGGTILHGTRKPLRDWFLAAFLMIQKSANARALQERLKLTYKVAWTWAHKLRRLMGLKTTRDEPTKPFPFEFRAARGAPTDERARRRWFFANGHFQWGAQRDGGLGRGSERLMSSDWNAPSGPRPCTSLTRNEMFCAYSGSMSDKHLRAYMDEAEFRRNHEHHKDAALLGTKDAAFVESVAELLRRFRSLRPQPYFEIRGDQRKRPPLRLRASRIEAEPVT